MKPFLVFLRQAIIPILWFGSVVSAFLGGFQPGYVPPPPPGQTYPYPWVGVIFTIFITAIKSVFLYLILRPRKFAWSLVRAGSAFAVFFILSILSAYTMATDQPGYAYVPGEFTFLLTFLLSILLVTTVVVNLTKYLMIRTQMK
ncbi:MAG: hypothetical protein QM730_01090 [Anaerolineales bacterium]